MEKHGFVGKNPNEILTQEELKHFDENMRLKNVSRPASEFDFERAARSVSRDLDRLLP